MAKTGWLLDNLWIDVISSNECSVSSTILAALIFVRYSKDQCDCVVILLARDILSLLIIATRARLRKLCC